MSHRPFRSRTSQHSFAFGKSACLALLLGACAAEPQGEEAEKTDGAKGTKEVNTGEASQPQDNLESADPTLSVEVNQRVVAQSPIDGEGSVESFSIALKAVPALTKTFDSKQSLIVSGLGGESYLSLATGDSLQFDFQQKKLLSPQLLSNANEFNSGYQIPGVGYVGHKETTLFFLDRDPANFAEADIHPESVNTIALFDTGLITQEDGNLYKIQLEDSVITKSLLTSGLETTITGAGMCAEGCEFWLLMGQDIFVSLAGSTSWMHFPKLVVKGDTFSRFTAKVTNKDGKLELSKALAIGPGEALFFQDGDLNQKKQASTATTLLLSQRFCIPCHQNDGFDTAKAFTDRKDDLLLRIAWDRREEAGAMPPITTSYGKDFSQEDRELMSSWLSAQDKTDGAGGVETPGEETDTKLLAAQPLLSLAEPKCIGCHTGDRKESWWVNNKADIKTRTESGNMPKGGRTMTAQERIDLVNWLDF